MVAPGEDPGPNDIFDSGVVATNRFCPVVMPRTKGEKQNEEVIRRFVATCWDRCPSG